MDWCPRWSPLEEEGSGVGNGVAWCHIACPANAAGWKHVPGQARVKSKERVLEKDGT